MILFCARVAQSLHKSLIVTYLPDTQIANAMVESWWQLFDDLRIASILCILLLVKQLR